jgi:hypothetical protein
MVDVSQGKHDTKYGHCAVTGVVEHRQVDVTVMSAGVGGRCRSGRLRWLEQQ